MLGSLLELLKHSRLAPPLQVADECEGAGATIRLLMNVADATHLITTAWGTGFTVKSTDPIKFRSGTIDVIYPKHAASS